MISESNPRFGREVELLLLATRPVLTGADVDGMHSLCSSDLDWDFLYQLARRHSLLPLLYHRLKTSHDAIPVDSLHKLRLAYQENVARNLIFADELAELTAALKNSGIESIAYKGPVLAKLAYGDAALRRFVDLDVMVRRADVPRAADVLINRGYAPVQDLTEGQQALLLSSQHNLQFTKHGRRLLLELHWQVSSHLFAESVTAEDLWNSLETVEVNGVELKTFSIDDLLFSLCVHGSRHLWERLAWITDIAHLLSRRPEINWQTLLRRAEVTQSERMFLLGVHLAAVLLGAPLPDQVRKRVASDGRLEKLGQDIIRRLFDGPEHHGATASQIFEYNFRVRTSWRSRFRYILFTLVPTERDVGSMRLPVGMGVAYYLIRPFRMFSKGQTKTSPGADA